MANRLSKIYTRTGDAGDTGRADGTRVGKDDVSIHAQGDIDELNSFIGLLACKVNDEGLAELLSRVQHDLFNIGAELSVSQQYISDGDTGFLEQQLDQYNADLPPLKEFILPGGSEAASLCHVARAVCRRAERSLVALNREKPIGVDTLAYVNRLSDLLFVLARILSREAGGKEVYWQPRKDEQ